MISDFIGPIFMVSWLLGISWYAFVTIFPDTPEQPNINCDHHGLVIGETVTWSLSGLRTGILLDCSHNMVSVDLGVGYWPVVQTKQGEFAR